MTLYVVISVITDGRDFSIRTDWADSPSVFGPANAVFTKEGWVEKRGDYAKLHTAVLKEVKRRGISLFSETRTP
ncbi:MAG: hypothetical protein A2653_03155 [Candidatus Zambryskibacteria bacterium RIFCSPHIGHO2_01_FULL_43_25]|uniref:Uncharacterized protein n=1 Tax=Candidatus Zambryskibacteria bacterium RIFCSPLOWO2_01_FULL_45_21 TaxID=1802761 RepID=A0A1G2U2J9_9BACT|nr:MAG: hypothetical protein A2653_03155 [Candidatus Zambryskibacteria bacterium RIFCSPHIGHO2_01_FULL_43_25]OHB00978.1 MAG: hypothetical protein A3E94_02190 [Candidatus Zambryskibacteria bacterium RIFCSPHIGHO2_12_FULL_44_12b]OHB03694.1 MAG: hypothetical protein A3B14_01465 [Candidatus Zambryskibacteria bacterium RIFCSPLOWO2_01_FULL_45_21]